MKINNKPALGVMPRTIWLHNRLYDLLNSCARFLEADKYKEMQELVTEIDNHLDYLVARSKVATSKKIGYVSNENN